MLFPIPFRAPILTMPEEPPVLFSCRACSFLCSDIHFLNAHRVIQHDLPISNTENIPDELVERKSAAKIVVPNDEGVNLLEKSVLSVGFDLME